MSPYLTCSPAHQRAAGLRLVYWASNEAIWYQFTLPMKKTHQCKRSKSSSLIFCVCFHTGILSVLSMRKYAKYHLASLLPSDQDTHAETGGQGTK